MEPCGACHFLHQHLSPGSCTRNETSTSASSLLCTALSLSLFFFIPRCVEPAGYDHSAPRDMLTLLVESPFATISQLSSQRLGPAVKLTKKEMLPFGGLLQLEMKGRDWQYRFIHVKRRMKNSLNSVQNELCWARFFTNVVLESFLQFDKLLQDLTNYLS